MEYYAHSKQLDSNNKQQTLKQHSEEAAIIAGADLAAIHLQKAAYISAFLHDMGKARARFQNYLADAAEGFPVKPGSVIHSFQGCKWILEQYHSGENAFEDLSSEILAFAAGAHHGLFDCIDEKRASGFRHRIYAENLDYEEALHAFFSQCISIEETHYLFKQAFEELEAVIKIIAKLSNSAENIRETYCFYLGLLTRMVLSAVIDGDCTSSANWENEIPCIQNASKQTEAPWSKLLQAVESTVDTLSNDSEINKVRSILSEQAVQFALNEGGILRLNSPTGAGKTLTSLRFALKHAEKHHKSRILFVSPLLSILEQNAKAIRDCIKDDSVILEHHSNVITEKMADEVQSEELSDEEARRNLLIETWDSPIIITTLVQLLNTLFSGKKSSIRRFHTLCNSVIVIDEIQSLPNRMLSMFNLAISFLANICNATVVLCSATQPCLEEAEHPIPNGTRDIIPYDPALWQVFSRTKIIDAGSMALCDIAAFCLQVVQKQKHLLVVCNTKKEALQIFSYIHERDFPCFHLSAAMCPEHRRTVLDQVKSFPKEKPMICVSTQVIEAGVDISFRTVIRLCAGLENVIQAAGRCNRHRESEALAPVYVVRCLGEELTFLKDIQLAKDAMLRLLDLFDKSPDAINNDLSSEAAVEKYYRFLYGKMKMVKGYQDYPVQRYRTTLFSLLSTNQTFADEDSDAEGYYLLQSFKLAGKLFQVFDEDTVDMVVPYGKGKALIEELKQRKYVTKEWIKKAGPYCVSIYRQQFNRIPESGCTEIDGVWVLDGGYYNAYTGLVPDGNGANSFAEG